jgi:hypothetical protein
MDLTETGCRDVEWIHLTQDGDQWWALVNTIINPKVVYNPGNFLCE